MLSIGFRVSGRCIGSCIRIEISRDLQAGLVEGRTVLCELAFWRDLGSKCLCGHLDSQMHLHESVGKFHGSVEILFHSGLSNEVE